MLNEFINLPWPRIILLFAFFYLLFLAFAWFYAEKILFPFPQPATYSKKEVDFFISIPNKIEIACIQEKAQKANGLVVKEENDFTSFWNELLIPNLKERYNTKPVHSLFEITYLKSKFPKIMKKLFLLFFTLISLIANAQGTRLLRQPTLSKTDIVFVYGADLWKVSVNGGNAIRLTSDTGNEFNEANLKMSFNAEYRFDLIGAFKGALFVDAGNIWNVADNVDESARRFDGFRDLDELAVGTGFGFRYDFGLFLLRLDMGFKTHNPVLPKGNRWNWNYQLKNANPTLGINYPF